MEPITVAGFVAAVAQLIDVTSKVVNYFNDVKNAPKERAKLAREATGLLALLTDLRYRMEDTPSTDSWFTGLRSLGGDGGPLKDFEGAMMDIADRLAPATTKAVNLKRALCWTLEKREIDAILSKIERLKTLVGLALQKDHFNLSLAMKEKITVGFQEMKTNRDVEKIIQWLAAPLPSSNHNTAMNKRQKSTGEWFTQSQDFADWKTRTSSFIWLHGIPGCGKTILCSTIIEDVISNFQSEPTIAVAYFYFDFNDPDKQQTELLVRSLLEQFAAQCPHLPELLQLAYSQSQNGRKQPTIEKMKPILLQMLKSFSSTYILLDALDECKDREELLEFLEALMGWNIDSLHLLTTSRKENDISTSLEPLVTCQLCIQSALINADIRVHVLERLSNDPKLKKWPVDVQAEIEDTLMRGANGMFRWVICQLDSLRKCLKLDALRKALKALPKTLDDTYERILSKLDEEYEEDALKVLQWLCFSARPMRLDEMVEVLAIDSTSECRFRPEQRLPDPRDILTICATLVSVTTAAGKKTSTQTMKTQLRLAHFSVKEYLISDRLKKASLKRYHITPLSANVSIAKTCLTYLLHFESPTILTAKFNDEFPLIGYAAEFWPWHYRQIPDDANREAVNFLGCKLAESRDSCFINWLRIFNPEKIFGRRRVWWRNLFRREKLSRQDLDLDVNKVLSPLYYMSSMGVSGVVQLLLDKGADINVKGGKYGNALFAAIHMNHEGIVRLLLEKGAEVSAEDEKYGYALFAAIHMNYEGVVRLLLEKGANVNANGGTYGNALSAASYSGSEEVVRLLLEKGAEVNAEGGKYGNALSAASYMCHDGIVRLLLENGANVNAEGGEYGNALSAAASLKRSEEVVQLLLEKGAKVNANGGIYGNALSAASYNGSEEVVRLLLEKGANINAEGGRYGNALSAAAASDIDSEGVVRLLLEKGANVNAEGGEFGNALSAASYMGWERVVRLLLEKGAEVNVEGGTYGNPLSAASSMNHIGIVRLLLEMGANVIYDNALSAASRHGSEEVVRLLLENGAKVNAEGEEYVNALSAASRMNHGGIVRLLLEKRANVNANGGEYGNALSAASYNGFEEVVRLLLEKGAEVNAEGGTYGYPLSAASSMNYIGIVRLLLEMGANVNANCEEYGNALSAAAASEIDSEGVVRLLLEKGANVNAEGGEFGNALSAASYMGWERVVRLLLEKGAEVNAEGGKYGNALSAASFNGSKRVVRLLLEKGANINAEGGKYGNALSAASFNGSKRVVRLLLEKGANINAEGGKYGNALSAASYGGWEGVVRFLLEKGAEVNAEGGKYGNALSAASYKGSENVVRLLLEKGANINAESGEYGNALSAASYGASEEVVRLLLEKGADVNAQSGQALREASKEGQEAVMRLLLENKADVSLVFHDDGKTLQGVSVEDREAVIQLLLKELRSS